MEGTCERVSRCSLLKLDFAFNQFFRSCKGKSKFICRYPRFRSSKNNRDSFTISGRIGVKGTKVRLPVIGWVSLKDIITYLLIKR